MNKNFNHAIQIDNALKRNGRNTFSITMWVGAQWQRGLHCAMSVFPLTVLYKDMHV